MPVAKHLFYARSRSHMERPRRIDALSFTYLSNYQDEARARVLRAPFEPRAITASPVAPQSIIPSAALLAGAVGETIFIVAAWMVSEILDGCAASALAMYGLPAAINDEKHGDISHFARYGVRPE